MKNRYDPTDWKNRVTDSNGEVIQEGTPLTSDNMNKLERQVAELSNERGEPFGTAPLDENGIVPARHLPSQVKEMRVVATIASRDALETFEGLRVLVTDATADETVEFGWAEYVFDGTKFVKVGEGESLDIAITWADIQGKPADISDKYTQAQVNALLQSKAEAEHIHAEFASITQLVNRVGVLEEVYTQSGHSHSNKATLDKLTYSGVKQTIDLNKLEEWETHTHSYNDLTDKPVIPAPVTVVNAVNNTSATSAASANAVKQAYDRANEAFTQAVDGKRLIVTAVNGKGNNLSSSATYQQIATAIGNISEGFKVSAGDTKTYYSSTSDSTTYSNTFAIVKTAQEMYFAGTVRVSFNLFGGGTNFSRADARICVNGVQVGATAYSYTSSSTTTKITRDIAVKVGDIITIEANAGVSTHTGDYAGVAYFGVRINENISV